jgi:hypothetical protein
VAKHIKEVLGDLPLRPATAGQGANHGHHGGGDSRQALCAALRGLRPSAVRDVLLTLVPSGIAFHNSDLDTEERDLVQRGYLAGAICVLTGERREKRTEKHLFFGLPFISQLLSLFLSLFLWTAQSSSSVMKFSISC